MSKPTVRLGSYGPVIRELQRNLNLGTSILAKLKEDGSFGGKTDARVREFQGHSKLIPDGVVGPMTWQAVEEFLLKVTELAGKVVQPADQEAARQRICDTAMLMYNQFGWNGQVDLKNPRIAVKKCADSLTCARQGGAQIFPSSRSPALRTRRSASRFPSRPNRCTDVSTRRRNGTLLTSFPGTAFSATTLQDIGAEDFQLASPIQPVRP